MVEVACLMMQKDEDDLLEPWLLYYGNLFGYANLFVFDNGSTAQKSISILHDYATRGVNVDFSRSRLIDFDRHEEEFGRMIGQLEAENRFDLFLPLDCDEFLVLDDPSAPNCDAAEIRSYLESLADQPGTLHIARSFANSIRRPSCYWRHDFSKVFFSRAGGCARLGYGYHTGEARLPGPPVETRLAQVHFHYKPFATLVAHARNKLEYYVDINDPENLRKYKGLNSHLVPYLLRSPAEYYATQVVEAGPIEFPQLSEQLTRLGAEPFWERWAAEAEAQIATSAGNAWAPPREHGIRWLAQKLYYARRAAGRKLRHVGRWLNAQHRA
jgi:hypothetical protein